MVVMAAGSTQAVRARVQSAAGVEEATTPGEAAGPLEIWGSLQPGHNRGAAGTVARVTGLESTQNAASAFPVYELGRLPALEEPLGPLRDQRVRPRLRAITGYKLSLHPRNLFLMLLPRLVWAAVRPGGWGND